MVLASVIIFSAIRIFSSVHAKPRVNEGMKPMFQLRRALVRGQAGVVPSFPSASPILSLSSIRSPGAPFNNTSLVCGCFLVRFQRVGHRTTLANVLFAEMACFLFWYCTHLR